MLFALSFPVHAQQPAKVPGIGFLIAGSDSAVTARVEALQLGLGEREGIFEGALDLFEEWGWQASQAFDNALLVNGFDLLCYDLGREGEAGVSFRDDDMARREAGCIFGQRYDGDELAELIDAIVGDHDGRTGLFDLDPNCRVEIDQDDITPPYGDHVSPGAFMPT